MLRKEVLYFMNDELERIVDQSEIDLIFGNVLACTWNDYAASRGTSISTAPCPTCKVPWRPFSWQILLHEFHFIVQKWACRWTCYDNWQIM